MAFKHRIQRFALSAAVSLTILFGLVAFAMPAGEALAQATETPADLESEPDLPGLLDAVKAMKAVEPLGGLVVGTAEYPRFGIRIHVFDFDQSRFQLRVVEQRSDKGSRASDFLAGENDVFVINGGFFERNRFNDRLSASGLVIVDGVTTSREHKRAGSGIIHTDGNGVGIQYRDKLRDRSGITHAVQVGPILVDPGGVKGIYKNVPKRFNRSAICRRNGSFTAFVVEGGISLFQFADLLSLPAQAGGFGCDIAINLDGGPSTQAILKAGAVSREIAGGTPVQNVLIVSKR